MSVCVCVCVSGCVPLHIKRDEKKRGKQMKEGTGNQTGREKRKSTQMNNDLTKKHIFDSKPRQDAWQQYIHQVQY